MQQRGENSSTLDDLAPGDLVDGDAHRPPRAEPSELLAIVENPPSPGDLVYPLAIARSPGCGPVQRCRYRIADLARSWGADNGHF